MQRLIVSMMRFSTAMTLYGYEQLQSSVGLIQGEQDFNKAMGRLQAAIDSLSDVLVNNLGGGKQETWRSIAGVAEDVMQRSLKGIRFVDPREMMKVTTDLIKKSSDALAGQIGKVTSIEGEDPRPAADVLS